MVVATSNVAPDELYKGGLNRALFLPFIAMLEARVAIVPVIGPRDYRLDHLRAAGTWFSPIDAEHERRLPLQLSGQTVAGRLTGLRRRGCAAASSA